MFWEFDSLFLAGMGIVTNGKYCDDDTGDCPLQYKDPIKYCVLFNRELSIDENKNGTNNVLRCAECKKATGEK